MPRLIQVQARKAGKTGSKQGVKISATLPTMRANSKPRLVTRAKTKTASPASPRTRGKADRTYQWILYSIKHDPLEHPGAKDDHYHRFSRIGSGTVRSSFEPGTIAREVFTSRVFGEAKQRLFDLNHIVAIHSDLGNTVTVFRGYKRLSDQGKFYTAVKTVAGPIKDVSPSKFRDMKWIRSHGQVLPERSGASVGTSPSASKAATTRSTRTTNPRATVTRRLIF
jgi:hypothetical protein